VVSFQLNLSHQVEVVGQSICVAQRSLQVDLYIRSLVIMLSHIKNKKVVNYRASSFDVYISAESKGPSYFLQVLCVLILVWSVTLQWYFMGPSFWRNPVAVYKVRCLSQCIVTNPQICCKLSVFWVSWYHWFLSPSWTSWLATNPFFLFIYIWFNYFSDVISSVIYFHYVNCLPAPN
jgi:hypothetical protein